MLFKNYIIPMYYVLPEGLNVGSGTSRKTKFWFVGIKYGIMS